MIYLDNAATKKMYDEVIDIEKDFEKNIVIKYKICQSKTHGQTVSYALYYL